ncbi:hypothetical protein GCM10017624_17360 [Azotobacter vinelandii]|nr:hypothetical protein GCM10017624_17360 [Azotobacter vinelandii]
MHGDLSVSIDPCAGASCAVFRPIGGVVERHALLNLSVAEDFGRATSAAAIGTGPSFPVDSVPD